jgi:cardiolipin synthase A/B
MSGVAARTSWTWLRSGGDAFPAMLSAIEAARESVRLETYIYSAGPLGDRFRDALVRARQRGASVRVLVDAVGSFSLNAAFWDPLLAGGGEARIFNPLALNRFGIRNHRKLLVCDDTVAFLGGFNISSEFDGDGVTTGWCDLGLAVRGPLVPQLAASFDDMFTRAQFRQKRFIRLRETSAKKILVTPNELLLLIGPGRGFSPIRRALLGDLARATNVRVIMGYFLPSLRIRSLLSRVARRGGSVQLMLAGKSDVLLSQLAGQSLYRRLLKADVQIFEYQPQILHAKLLVLDDIVYVGSANLDQRSLNINYELMLRFEDREMAAQAREIFAEHLGHCRPITLEGWTRSRTFWGRLKRRWAYFLLVHLDPRIAQRQWRFLPD